MNTQSKLNKLRLQNTKDWIESCEWWIGETQSDIQNEWYDQASLDYERAKKRLIWAKDNLSKIVKSSKKQKVGSVD